MMPTGHATPKPPPIDSGMIYRVAQKGVAAIKQIAAEAYTETGATSEPPIEKLSDYDNVTYYISLPGVKKADIQVNANGNCLEIIAKRESPFIGGKTTTGEIAYGELKREIDMGNLFLHSKDQISSSYEDGMLILVVSRKPSGRISVDL